MENKAQELVYKYGLILSLQVIDEILKSHSTNTSGAVDNYKIASEYWLGVREEIYSIHAEYNMKWN